MDGWMADGLAGWMMDKWKEWTAEPMLQLPHPERSQKGKMLQTK